MMIIFSSLVSCKYNLTYFFAISLIYMNLLFFPSKSQNLKVVSQKSPNSDISLTNELIWFEFNPALSQNTLRDSS